MNRFFLDKSMALMRFRINVQGKKNSINDYINPLISYK